MILQSPEKMFLCFRRSPVYPPYCHQVAFILALSALEGRVLTYFDTALTLVMFLICKPVWVPWSHGDFLLLWS